MSNLVENIWQFLKLFDTKKYLGILGSAFYYFEICALKVAIGVTDIKQL